MPQKVLRFTGINRSVNEFQNSGACEELINIRPAVGGGLNIVKRKSVYKQDVDYAYFYEHAFGDTNNQIAVNHNAEVVWVNGGDGTPLEKFTTPEVTISHVNNIVVIYSYSDDRQVAFKFEDGAYKMYYAAPASLFAWMDYRSETGYPNFVTATGYSDDGGDIMDTDRWLEATSNAMSVFHRSHKNGLCGVSIVGCTYELEDGNEVWSSAFVVADSSKARKDNTTRNDVKPHISNPNGMCSVRVTGVKECWYMLSANAESFKGIKKIKVYATKPASTYTFAYLDDKTHGPVKQSLSTINLDGQLMYYKGSINVDGSLNLALSFADNMYGEDVMPVTSGAIERIGPSVSLNNRFHFFKSNVHHVVQKPTTSEQAQVIDGFTIWQAYVKFENGWRLIDRDYTFSETESIDFMYPLAEVTKIIFVKKNQRNGFIVEMNSSSAYNYSYAFDVMPKVERLSDDIFNEMTDVTDTKVLLRNEVNAINVTVKLNPYAFDINASYSFGGEIKDIVTSYVPISAVQVNQFPITVFTTAGIYALEQGSGNTLYGGITALQPLELEGGTISVPKGVLFVSAKKLYLLDGREAIDMSHPMNGKIDEDMSKLESYNTLMNITGSDFTEFLSTKEFGDYLSSANLLYDQLHNEIIISSSDDNDNYSYVLNLDTLTFHKIPLKYVGKTNSKRYALEERFGIADVVDMHNEEHGNANVVLQSRPLQLEPFLTHIQRLIVLSDAKLSGNNKMLVSVFASDNLNNWKCIISSQKKDVALRQIRTNKAAKSYRDYVILITGNVQTDTDMSDIIADYTVVNRRLG